MEVQTHDIWNALKHPRLRRDPPRKEEHYKIRVGVRPRSTAVYGRLLRKGTHEIVVPKSELPIIQDMVETETEAIKRCEEQLKKKRDEYIAERTKRGEDKDDAGRHFDSQVDEPNSVEMYFCQQVRKTGIKPLLFCEVLETGLGYEKTPAEREFEAMLSAQRIDSDALGHAIAQGVVGALAPLLAASGSNFDVDALRSLLTPVTAPQEPAPEQPAQDPPEAQEAPQEPAVLADGAVTEGPVAMNQNVPSEPLEAASEEAQEPAPEPPLHRRRRR